MQPLLPIEVNEETGVWTTDGLPMIYVPRHFFVNNHSAVADALGADRYAEILYPAGYKSAYFWCDKEAKTHGISGLAVFEHYLKRLSQRGWGQFSIDVLDIAGRRGSISLKNSIFALEAGQQRGQRVCYMFEGFITGAFAFLLGLADPTAVECEETYCACDGRHDHCRFDFAAMP